MSVKKGTLVLKNDIPVAFVPDDKDEVIFIEGMNKVATVSSELVEYVYERIVHSFDKKVSK